MRTTLSRSLGAALLGAASLSAAADIDVMTQNQYLGTDLAPVFGAAGAGPAAFNAAVVTALAQVAAARPAERIKALAATIAQRRPDVVALQEAYKFECLPYPAPFAGEACDHPALKAAFTDQLANTVAALRGRYRLVAKVTQMKIDEPIGIPFTTDGVHYGLLRLADRDAILVRTDHAVAAPVPLAALTGCRASDDGCNFFPLGSPAQLSTPLGTLAIERGYVAVDLTVRGRSYRIFNTHLEQRLLDPSMPETRLLQVAEAGELLQSALRTYETGRHVIVAGDFNSDLADPSIQLPDGSTAPTPYMIFTGNGFTDTWLRRPHWEVGYSCCQLTDLSNFRSALYERIDLIFSFTPPSRVVDMKLIGATVGDKTRPAGHGGLWPSDHASLAAKLFFD